MNKYENLDNAIMSMMSVEPQPFGAINVQDVLVESERIASAEPGTVEAFRVVDRRLQALRKAGKIKYTTKGWVRVQAHYSTTESGTDAESVAAVTWPTSPGWYWAHGRIAGMREATLMSARAMQEGEKLIVYVGEAMTHRLSFPDPELPLQFKPAVLPKF